LRVLRRVLSHPLTTSPWTKRDQAEQNEPVALPHQGSTRVALTRIHISSALHAHLVAAHNNGRSGVGTKPGVGLRTGCRIYDREAEVLQNRAGVDVVWKKIQKFDSFPSKTRQTPISYWPSLIPIRRSPLERCSNWPPNRRTGPAVDTAGSKASMNRAVSVESALCRWHTLACRTGSGR
jgi:hypothetical protein